MQIISEEVARAVSLVEDGRSVRYAARAIGKPETTVRRAVQRYRETHMYTRRRGSGRPRATSARDDRFLMLQSLRNRHQTAVELAHRLRTVRDRAVSAQTVRRRLVEGGLKSRRPARVPTLTVRHRQQRLQFARFHENWDENNWRRVLFSDESRFCLRSPDGRHRVWRRTGERISAATVVQQENFWGGSVMVWGGISLEAKTELFVLQQRSLNANAYIRDILQDHVVPFAPFIGPDFLFMQDNARPHVARCVINFLEEVEIERLEWPAMSPDMNPIEHVWDELGRRVRARAARPETLQELQLALVEEWDNIDQNVIAHLIEGMPRRISALLNARGGNTRY